MSNIFITDIVGTGTYAIPTNDTQLASATSGFDTILSGVANLSYDRVLAWVEDQAGPNGAEGVRTLNCLVEKFTYLTKECPSEAEVDTLGTAIESALEADANITSIDQQQYHLFQAGAYFLWNRDAAGGFLYPNTTTDDVAVGGHAAPKGKWFDDGDLVLGAAAMSGTEVLRVVGNARVEGDVALTELSDHSTASAAGLGIFWVKDDAPNVPYFTDDAGTDNQLAYLTDAVKSFITWGDDSIATSTTTRYLTPWFDDGTAETTEASYRVPSAGTAQNLRVRARVAGTGAATLTYTLMVNGGASALAVAMSNTVQDGSDLVNTVSLSAGDLISIRVTKSASLSSSPDDIVASLEVTS